tara:strand:+ start:178 stop:489 length:312 start_codon:yes stop_codon:yes gene_type:complete
LDTKNDEAQDHTEEAQRGCASHDAKVGQGRTTHRQEEAGQQASLQRKGLMPMGVYADMELDRIVFDGLPPVEEKKSDEDKPREEKSDDQQRVRSPGPEVPGSM